MRGAAFGLLAFFLYVLPLTLLLSGVDLLLGVGHPHDAAFGWATMVYTVAWVGAAVDWLAR